MGLGEASPLPGLSLDDVAAVERALNRFDVRAANQALFALEEAPPAHPAARRARLGSAVELVLGDAALAVPSAVFAIETALADLASQRADRPLSAWLAPDTLLEPISRSVLIGALDDGAIERALAALERGAAHVKLKVRGADLEDELERLRAVAGALSGRAAIRLDMNGAEDPEGARRAAFVYARAGASVVEEPTAGASLLSLGELALPWLADESLVLVALRRAFLEATACAGLVLKPTLLGGLAVCLDLAERSRGAGKSVVVTHAFDGPVALAAAAELALACQADLAGLDAHAALGEGWSDRIATLPGRGAPLAVVPAELPGLALDDDARRSLAMRFEGSTG